ncbi:hypothetical protein ACE7GA_21395 [Roseomonas sp. CCTCC AB2023176]|uniref:hypothetical protein n=1 Tax=Roseomonas sp. CCTCC AB2023176 TaxID=3342640 RepID=UPI0035E02AFC
MLDFVADPVRPSPLGVGFYTAPEVARLLRIPAKNINRWLGGYQFSTGERDVEMAPLWEPHLPRGEKHLELSFRDLIELRFVQAFLKAGVSLRTVRHCIQLARAATDDDRPFSTRRFKTDGKTIFLESLTGANDGALLDLRRHQFVIKQVIERTFKDLDIEDDAVARWRPFNGKSSIVVDPKRSFGQPVTSRYGVPTIALADAVKAEKSEQRVAYLYNVSPGAVRDAMAFERSLLAA